MNTRSLTQTKPISSFTPVSSRLLQRKCACGGAAGLTGNCSKCEDKRLTLQRRSSDRSEPREVPPIVHEVLGESGQPLDSNTRTFMESRFGHDFSQVRVHTGEKAARSAQAVDALAYTVKRNVVFATGQYTPRTTAGKRLLAHELTHVVQQANNTVQKVTEVSQPGNIYEREAEQAAEQIVQTPIGVASDVGSNKTKQSLPTIQRQAEEVETIEEGEEGIEVGDQLMILPQWQISTLPTEITPIASQGNGMPILQRQGGAVNACTTPTTMRKVTSGKFEGGKTLDDYFPDLVAQGSWGASDTAGTFDNGSRAGSAVQLIGVYPSPCWPDPGKNFTLGQTVTVVRARADDKKIMERGKPLEGQKIDDIKRSGRDQSKPPFRQEFNFSISMADPISGIPYAPLKSYEFEANLTTSISGAGGSKSVDWGITVEASAGKVTKNELR